MSTDPSAAGSPSSAAHSPATPADLARVQAAIARIRNQLQQAIVGQSSVIDDLLTALLAGGHCLLVGVPGLAKTLMVRSMAETLGLTFQRIQFTPDLMPADITGTDVIQEDRMAGTRQLTFMRGPVFANVILADEINRTPPKTQAALLEAMQERQVTISGQRHGLPDPFFVLATQNPIEQEGTYPLPEAQLDRFMLQVFVDYPSEEEEYRIVCQTTATESVRIDKVVTGEELIAMQSIVRQLPIAEHVTRYALALSRSTRKEAPEAPEIVRKYVRWGAGPRASQYLVLAAKARAAMLGENHVTPEHVRAVAKPVLRHRIMTNFHAEADRVTTDRIVDSLLEATPLVPTHRSSLAPVAAVLKR
ncbi:AAA family ATPase [Planctomyces sp. SH-PL14]|uniref:AAA family ATPase n=1 Tax=Planctomyces sp. SH-PL14 TaxID=1632864 RepID=UPI00078E7F1F|nr:MoxR family ATPase [Planctomyces sp. SH-PL14]AMV19664.1 ATPase RavA [Planctomyces sp. SH-PL14]